MKIAIVAPSPVPFTVGGAERASNGILKELREHTPHEAELLKLPSPESTLGEIVASYESFSRLDLSHFDLVITNKYPAWLVNHPNHVAYVFHGLRALYDRYYLFGSSEGDQVDEPDLAALRELMRRPPERPLLDEFFERFWQIWADRGHTDPMLRFPGPLAREIVRFLDGVALGPSSVRRYLALSETVRSRAEYFPPNAAVEVLYVPSFLEGFRCESFDYFFTTSRLADHKRVHLLVEAMRHVTAEVPLKIAGTGPEQARLHARAAGDSRIQFLGLLSDEALIEAYANALAVPFVPLDEEMGLITIEAMESSKPVVTARDSGGPTEFVEDGVNGYVTDPTPEAIGAAMSRLAVDRSLARTLGRAGQRRVEGITWRNTVRALLRHETRSAPRPRPTGRRRVAVASTRPLLGAEEGSRRELLLLQALSQAFDVEVVSLGPEQQPLLRRSIASGLSEAVVPRSRSHARAERELARLVDDLPVGDAAAAALIVYTSEYLAALRRTARGAAGIILCRPFLVHAAQLATSEVPLFYSVEQAEAKAVRELVPRWAPAADWLLRATEQAESAATLQSLRLLTSHEGDAEALASEYGVSAESFVTVPTVHGARAMRFVASPDRRELRERWLGRFFTAVPRPAFASRVAVYRAAADLTDTAGARAVVQLASELPQVLFVVVGLEARNLGASTLPDNVVVTDGGSGAVYALLSCADIALEPGPVASARADMRLVEYLAAGVPVVSTPQAARFPGLVDGENVLVAPVPEFPRAIERLLGQPDLLDRLSMAGRALIEEDQNGQGSAGIGHVVERALEDATSPVSALSVG
jgi:glycosyltransferase involved in cell wall biosynthesis